MPSPLSLAQPSPHVVYTQSTVALDDLVVTTAEVEINHAARTRTQTRQSSSLKSVIGSHYERGHKGSLTYIRDGEMLIFPSNEHKLRLGRPIKLSRRNRGGGDSDDDGAPLQ
jgi:hypothetical protein